MTWLEKIQTDFTITTGDGKSYSPQWLNAARAVEYNVSVFDFVDTAGSLVDRREPKARSLPIEIYFQGAEHLDEGLAFEESAADPRPWTITHPFYGRLLVQPLGLVFDNQDYNVTRITGTVLETLSDTPNVPALVPADKIAQDKNAADAKLAEAYATQVPAPSAKDARTMIAGIAGSYGAVVASVTNTVDAQQLTNAFNLANAAVSGGITSSLGAITAIQRAVTLPFQFAGTAIGRIQQLGSILKYLVSSLTGNAGPSQKRLFEATAGAVVSGGAAAAFLNPNGYVRRTQVVEVVGALIDLQATYTGALEALQTATGGAPGSYIPSAEPMAALSALVSYTVTSLLNLATTTKQERTVFLEADSNVILLVQRFYGKGSDDAALDDFIAVNNIGLNEFLEVRAGRKITYYV